MKTWELSVIIVIIVVVAVVVVIYQSSYILIKSKIDGRTYKVKNNELAQKSADSLAHININLLNLKTYIQGLPNPPEYAQRLNRFNPNTISENIFNIDTTYTINKGESMYFCLGSREELELYDLNTMLYVAIHELAHVVSIDVGHGDEFKKNFASLLRHAIEIDMYKYVDYTKNPQEYCGINITKNII